MDKKEIEKNLEKVFEELGMEAMSDEQKKIFVERTLDRFDKATLEAVIISLDDNQAEEFEKALEDDKNLEDLVAEIAAKIPGLSERINLAITGEWANIKKALQLSKANR